LPGRFARTDLASLDGDWGLLVAIGRPPLRTKDRVLDWFVSRTAVTRRGRRPASRGKPAQRSARPCSERSARQAFPICRRARLNRSKSAD